MGSQSARWTEVRHRFQVLSILLTCVAALLLAACDDSKAKLTQAKPNPALNKVLILGQQSSISGMTFVSAYLAPFGFKQISLMENTSTTPTLAQLQAYDVVLVWSDSPFLDAVTTGDNLASFVNGGGGLVMAAFVWLASPAALSGAIATGGVLSVQF
jgi:hypothetical protein